MQDIVDKWGESVALRGFTQIPNYLLQLNLFVHEDSQLSPTEMMVLLQLVGAWWKKDEMPYPSMATLAKRAGMSERQVQRSVKVLEEKGYLRRSRKNLSGVIASNAYDLTPLVEALRAIARAFPPDRPRAVKSGTSSSERSVKKQVMRRIQETTGVRINVGEPHELKHWTKALGVSEADLRAAIQKVGTNADDVRNELTHPGSTEDHRGVA